MMSLWRQQIYRKTVMFLIVTVLVLVPIVAFAQTGTEEPGLIEQGWNAVTGAIGSAVGSVADWLFKPLARLWIDIAIALGGFVLMLGSLFLDQAIFRLIINMGSFFQGDGGIGSAVALGWRLIRDLFNMAFIFGLIFIGIKTILNSEDSNTRRQLGYLIAAALLINFSLYITQLIVDLSNLVANQFYKILAPNAAQQAGDGILAAISPIGARFIDAASLTSIFSGNTSNIEASIHMLFLYGLLVFFFFCFAGIAFFLGAIMVITRFVALILYMIFSPVMFLGWILPQFQKMSSDWWAGFLKYAFFGPVYIFLLMIASQVLLGAKEMLEPTTSSGQQAGLGGLLSGDRFEPDALNLVMMFAIMIGLLIASLKVGDKLSISGSKFAMSSIKRTGGVMTAGVAGWGLRSSVGWAANKYAESDGGQRRARTTVIGRQMMRAADATRNASFDARAVGGLSKAGLGKAQKGGYAQAQKDVEKRAKDAAKLIGSEDTRIYADAGLTKEHEDFKKAEERRGNLIRQLSKTTDPRQRQKLAAQIKQMDTNIENNFGKGTKYGDLKKDMKKMIQNEYAANLEKQFAVFGSTKRGRKDAADALRKDVNKSKTEAALDTLKDEMSKSGKD